MLKILASIALAVTLCGPSFAADETSDYIKTLKERVSQLQKTERACYDSRMHEIANDPARPNMGTSTVEMVLAECQKS